MHGLRKGEWSAITKVKVLSPEICLIALGQGFLHPEASIAANDIGECDSDVPGSESMASHSKIHSGTWEGHIIPDREASSGSKRRRRKYGDMAVGPGHIRGVDWVMPIESREPGAPEGPGSKMQRDEQRMPYTEMDNITPAKLALISERARKDPKFQFISLAHLLNEGLLKECCYQLGRDRANGRDGVLAHFRLMSESC
jgi:hypothetical protein